MHPLIVRCKLNKGSDYLSIRFCEGVLAKSVHCLLCQETGSWVVKLGEIAIVQCKTIPGPNHFKDAG
ncbi:hypothetical protein QE152_g1069 [Popillia japonica]|uniref:Uncharacterized protein n=1 Tax=Popillia japonica TaxID=7064 RepID=A0AAW1N9U3_POPJA